MTKCHTKTLQSVFSRVHLVSVDATAKQKNNSVTVKKSRGKAAQNYERCKIMMMWRIVQIVITKPKR